MKISFNGNVISAKIRKADSFWTKLLGYMFSARPNDDDGILFYVNKQNSIHTFFMFFMLDVVYLKADGTVVKIFRGLKPWRMTWFYPDASLVLELPSGKLPVEVKEGSKLEVADV